ncbi:hypothetical protein TNIN_274421 [Trichonephila inaurata madagascariensis]|uniref:Uncharacterized protein n=1 Tax=Trichonephila inaurata madagascariensis TaxID=2747483 RepID=A0A8X6XFP5_9ARAC|nr:hypothetical protein TNIN_274421 [Trichonephila inaurata madagascariensis]
MSTFTDVCYFISENSISIGTEPTEASTNPQATNPPPQAGNEEWTKEESRLCQSTIVHQKGRPVVFILFLLARSILSVSCGVFYFYSEGFGFAFTESLRESI